MVRLRADGENRTHVLDDKNLSKYILHLLYQSNDPGVLINEGNKVLSKLIQILLLALEQLGVIQSDGLSLQVLEKCRDVDTAAQK